MKQTNTLLANAALMVAGLLILSGCITQRKVTDYLNNHPEVAAPYCAEKYPVVEKRDTVVASSDSIKTAIYKEAMDYADSLIKSAPRDSVYIVGSTKYIVRQADTAAIKRDIEKRLKSLLKPCDPVIKTITITQENTAKITALQIKLDVKDNVISKRDARIAHLEWYVKAFYWLLGIIIALLLYTFRKLWIPLLTKVI